MISKFTMMVLAVALMSFSINESLAAESVVQTSKDGRQSKPRIERKKQRRRATAANQRSKPSVGKAPSVEKSAARYQMLSTDHGVIVLDTHTGETKVIDMAARPPQQNIEVGRAWVVVTVLTNVSKEDGSEHDD